MTAEGSDFDRALARAGDHARDWLASMATRRVAPSASTEQLLHTAFSAPLPAQGEDPAAVIDELVAGATPGLMATGSGRFFGWVIGGALPAALGADWLVSAWDQNAGLSYASPAATAIEHAAGGWLLDLLGLPSGADVGFVTGATMANFTGLASARSAVLARSGWDLADDGMAGSPKLHVLVGAQRHDTIDLALRYLGLGAPTVVAADDQGRIRIDALAEALAEIPGGAPIILCLQAGNLHSGAFDPFTEAIALAHARGGWVHVDGAFGLWAAAADDLRHLIVGYADADSWATDAHKTLNVPYDCGVAIVADPTALRTAFGLQTSYLIADASGVGDPHEKVPELSRRGRGIPVWAALRSLGRDGVGALVSGLASNARALADGVAQIDGARILNDVIYTQVCVSFGSDERTRAVIAALLEAGDTWMSGSRWAGQEVLRISVSNWSTDAQDITRSVEAVRRAAAVA